MLGLGLSFEDTIQPITEGSSELTQFDDVGDQTLVFGPLPFSSPSLLTEKVLDLCFLKLCAAKRLMGGSGS